VGNFARKRPRQVKKGSLADYKRLGWKVKVADRQKRKGRWEARKRGVCVKAACLRSLINRMAAAEVAGKWKT
jgi:hypothetical protein